MLIPGTQVQATFYTFTKHDPPLYYSPNEGSLALASVNAGNSDGLCVGLGGVNGGFKLDLTNSNQKKVDLTNCIQQSGVDDYQDRHLKLLAKVGIGGAGQQSYADTDPCGFSYLNARHKINAIAGWYEGVCFADIFDAALRPHGNANNAAMLYLAPPYGPHYLDAPSFLAAIQLAASNIIKTIGEYNVIAAAAAHPSLPQIQAVRNTLFSSLNYNTHGLANDPIARAIFAGMAAELKNQPASGGLAELQFPVGTGSQSPLFAAVEADLKGVVVPAHPVRRPIRIEPPGRIVEGGRGSKPVDAPVDDHDADADEAAEMQQIGGDEDAQFALDNAEVDAGNADDASGEVASDINQLEAQAHAGNPAPGGEYQRVTSSIFKKAIKNEYEAADSPLGDKGGSDGAKKACAIAGVVGGVVVVVGVIGAIIWGFIGGAGRKRFGPGDLELKATPIDVDEPNDSKLVALDVLARNRNETGVQYVNGVWLVDAAADTNVTTLADAKGNGTWSVTPEMLVEFTPASTPVAGDVSVGYRLQGSLDPAKYDQSDASTITIHFKAPAAILKPTATALDTMNTTATVPFSAADQTVAVSAKVTSADAATTVNEGSVTFTLTLPGAAAVGTPLNQTVAAGVTKGSLTVPGGTAAGPYKLTASYGGSQTFATSASGDLTFTITPLAASGPLITTQPKNQTVLTGGTATFAAVAMSWTSVQWQVSANGGGFTDIAGATLATLQFPVDATLNANRYQAVFTNASGSVVTSIATLTVTAALFVCDNTKTQGNWPAVFGAEGWEIAGVGLSPAPSTKFWTLTNSGAVFTYAQGMFTKPNALRKSGDGTDAVAAAFYPSGTDSSGAAIKSLTLTVSVKDTDPHQIALYMADFDKDGRVQTVVVSDSKGLTLDTRTYTNFENGVYGIWDFVGSITITLTELKGNATVSAIFFDPMQAPMAAHCLLAARLVSGKSGGIDVLAQALSMHPKDPSSVILTGVADLGVANAAASVWLRGDGKAMGVPGEGVWLVDDHGTIVFQADPTLDVPPTPASFCFSDIHGNQSNDALILINPGLEQARALPAKLAGLSDAAFWANVKSNLLDDAEMDPATFAAAVYTLTQALRFRVAPGANPIAKADFDAAYKAWGAAQAWDDLDRECAATVKKCLKAGAPALAERYWRVWLMSQMLCKAIADANSNGAAGNGN